MPIIQNDVGLDLEKIVVATDFTPESEKALVYARNLARHFASKLIVTHVVDLSIATPSELALVGFSLDSMRHDSNENMENILSDLEIEGISAEGKTIEAHRPAAAIINLSQEIDADLVLVGTHHRKGLSKLILGSCSESIIHSANCPVLTIGPNVKLNPEGVDFRTIVFATDLHHNAASNAAVALAFAKESVANIYMCRIIETAESNLANCFQQQTHAESVISKLIPDASYTWCTPLPTAEFGNVEDEILRIAKETNADLIVLGVHRSIRWFSRLWDGIVERIIGQAACPVMTIASN